MVYLTYDEWKSIGFGVIRGSKSRKRNPSGAAVFGFDQVTRTPTPTVRPYQPSRDPFMKTMMGMAQDMK